MDKTGALCINEMFVHLAAQLMHKLCKVSDPMAQASSTVSLFPPPTINFFPSQLAGTSESRWILFTFVPRFSLFCSEPFQSSGFSIYGLNNVQVLHRDVELRELIVPGMESRPACGSCRIFVRRWRWWKRLIVLSSTTSFLYREKFRLGFGFILQ